jgi:hypothetical protein
MRKTCLCAVLSLTLAGAAAAELDTVWVDTYGGPASDGFRSAVTTSDGGFIAAGYTYSYGAGDVDVFVVKTDSYGDTLWIRAYGGPSLDYGHGVCEVDGGAYVVAGYTMSFGSGYEDVYLLKLDAGGDTLWARTYGGAGSDEAKSVCYTSDGYIVVAGRTESFGAGQSDVYILKVDAAGDTVWSRTYGGAEADWAENVCETADGCYGIGGTTGSFSATRDAYMLKVDPSGTLVWEDNYGIVVLYREDYGMGICALPDSGMAASGFRTDQDHGDPCEAGFLRVFGNGGQICYRKYFAPSIEYGCSICETSDQGFLICGSVKDPDTHRSNLFLVKRVQGTGWVWDQTIGGAACDWGNSIVEIEPARYLIAGYTGSSGNGGFDGWLLVMEEEDAAVPPVVETIGGAYLAAPDPNPFGPQTNLRFTLKETASVRLAVYDISGRRVAVLAEGLYEPGEYHEVWNGEDESGAEVCPGVYLARLAAGGMSTSRKIVYLRF